LRRKLNCCVSPWNQLPAWKKANLAAAQDAKQKADEWASQRPPPNLAAAAASGTGGPAAAPLPNSLLPAALLPAALLPATLLAAPLAAAASAVQSVRRDVDRLATQRTAAGLKAEKHGAVDVVLLKPNPSAALARLHHTSPTFVYNPNPARGDPYGNQNFNPNFNANFNFNHHRAAERELPDAQRRFLSVSNGAVFVASYFVLLEAGGFVECSAVKRSASSEKVADLLACTVEVGGPRARPRASEGSKG
jgi:hypothetical protein